MTGSKHLIGDVRIAFELHSMHGELWMVVKDSADLRELQPAAAMLVERQEVDGIRLVQRLDYVDHDFKSTTTLLKRIRSGIQETDPLQTAAPGKDPTWCETVEDFRGDQQRRMIRTLLTKFVDDQRLTPVEILYHDGYAKTLCNAGTLVQGALQRLAAQQVRGTKVSAVQRVKDLQALVDKGLNELQADAKAAPTPKLAPGGLGGISSGPQALTLPRIYRAVAEYLKGCKTYTEKLDKLFGLLGADPVLTEMRVVDTIVSELLAAPLCLKELLGGTEGVRYELVTNLIDMYAGRAKETGKPSTGIQAMAERFAQGVLPRSMAELRAAVLKHIHARVPLRGKSNLLTEMMALRDLSQYIQASAPALWRDEEVQEALQARADRLVSPDAVGEFTGHTRSVLSRIDHFLGLVDVVAWPTARGRLAPYLRSMIVPEEMIREVGGARVGAIPTLANLARRIAQTPFPEAIRREMVDILDSALFDTIRTEIVSKQTDAFVDRILNLVRLGGNLPEGKAKSFASDTLSVALKRPEFMAAYLQRFATPEAKRDAHEKLCALLLESGLVPQSLIPSAA